MNSSQDDDYVNLTDPSQPGQQTPGPRKKTSFAKKTTFENDNQNKQESILRKEQKQQRTRFSDETYDDERPSKNVSFCPPDQKTQQSKVPAQAKPKGMQHQQQQQQIKQPEAKSKPEQNLEKLGITQIHPKPHYNEPEESQYYENRQPYCQETYEYRQQQYCHENEYRQPYFQEDDSKPQIPYSQVYQDLQEKKIQEVTSHLTSQLLKKHDQQYNYDNLRRRSSVKSANLSDNLTCQVEHRRTSVPNWSSNKINLTEKKNNTKNTERKQMYVEERSWKEDRRPMCKKHGGGGYIEFSGSDKETYGSDYEGFGSEKDIYSNGSYQNYGYRESQEGYGSTGVVKYIDKDEYWVTQPDMLSRRGSGSQKGRMSPYLLKDNVNNLSSPNVPTSVIDSAQNQGKTVFKMVFFFLK